MTGKDERIGREPAAREGEGPARRVVQGMRSPKEKAILAAKVTMAMLAAQAAFTAYAYAQDTGGDGGSNPPPPAPSGAPAVVQTVPADGKTGFDRDKSIRAMFSEDMDPATINGATVYLVRGKLDNDDLNPPPPEPGTIPPAPSPGGGIVAATVKYDPYYDAAVVNPNKRLAERANYTGVVEGAGDSDGKAVEDAGGTPMEEDHIFHFKTGLG